MCSLEDKPGNEATICIAWEISLGTRLPYVTTPLFVAYNTCITHGLRLHIYLL